jgi:hypothetical protein
MQNYTEVFLLYTCTYFFSPVFFMNTFFCFLYIDTETTEPNLTPERTRSQGSLWVRSEFAFRNSAFDLGPLRVKKFALGSLSGCVLCPHA